MNCHSVKWTILKDSTERQRVVMSFTFLSHSLPPPFNFPLTTRLRQRKKEFKRAQTAHFSFETT